MKKNDFYQLFLDQIRDLFSAENQLIEALPKMAAAATSPELKAAFKSHLKETQMQAERLKKIFSSLNESSGSEVCDAMKGLIKEGSKIIAHDYEPLVKDAALIAAAQRVEHYEIAGYGVAKTFATHLKLSEAADLLENSLDEESNANEKLTSIAEGGYFSSGINQKALAH